MKAKIIFYSQKNILPNKRTKFKKELTGHKDASHGGRYKYKIMGLLDQMEYIKPCHAALIVKNKDKAKVIKLIEKYGIQYVEYNIEVKQKEFNK